MRDHAWLQDKLDELLKTYFASVPINNPIEIKWGRDAKFRFGSIRLEKPRGMSLKLLKKLRSLKEDVTPSKSVITVTRMFASEEIPVGVVEYTICHELCHYAHGFSSTNKQMFRHPHHGGIINRELKERGADHLIPIYRRWLKDYRAKILAGRTRMF